MLSSLELGNILSRFQKIAIVGAKDKEGQPVDRVGRYLISAGYNIFPVHPKRKTVWGLTAYPTLLDLPEPVDIVNLFRAAQFCPEHAKETLQLKKFPLVFWMQEGIRSQEAKKILDTSNIEIVEDTCIMTVHKQTLGQKNVRKGL